MTNLRKTGDKEFPYEFADGSLLSKETGTSSTGKSITYYQRYVDDGPFWIEREEFSSMKKVRETAKHIRQNEDAMRATFDIKTKEDCEYTGGIWVKSFTKKDGTKVQGYCRWK